MARKNLPKKNQFKDESIKDYKLEEEIGRGNIGVVYRAHHKDIEDLKAAIKIIPPENLKDGWEVELKKVGLLDNKSQVVQYKNHNAEILDGVPYICIFWQYVDGDNLEKYAEKYSDNITLTFVELLINQILDLFIAMKEKGIIHGDLHEGNILIEHSQSQRYPGEAAIKVTDFGIGGSRNRLEPKNDYAQLAFICHNLLEKYIEPYRLNGENRFVYDKLVEDFLPKKILEDNQIVGDFVREPRNLLTHLENIRNDYRSEAASKPIFLPLKHPFDYLSCEEMGNSFEAMQTLYSENFPGYNTLLQKTNTILTGPRGCGKTTIFRNLSLKTQLLGGKKGDIEDLDDYVGIYYHCSDLYFAFPYLTDNISETDRRIIIQFFNLAILCEVLDTVIIAKNNLFSKTKRPSNFDELQEYIQKYFPSYRITQTGIPGLDHMIDFVNIKKEETKTLMEMGKQDQLPKPFLPLDFIRNICQILQRTLPWLKGRAIYIFLDDYSLPRISKSIQETLHDFILHRYSECFFKISTESITTFYPYDSKGKLIEETREYDIIDLGAQFLSASDEAKNIFLKGVINNRLENTKDIYYDYQNVETILGISNRAYNQLARDIREKKAGKQVHYYGWDVIIDLCSGDIVNILRLIRDIITLSGGPEKFSELNGISIPIREDKQDRAIRETGNDFLSRIEAVPNIGEDLRKIADAFGTVANWYLRNRNSKNQAQNPPWQAFRLEVRDTPYFEDSLLEEAKKKYNIDNNVTTEKLELLYKDLIRYGIFLRDIRGKGQRGTVIPRLYLRRLLIPTFLLTPSKRDSVGVEVGEFFMLLSNPEEFVTHMKKKEPNDDEQMRFDL